MRAAVNLNHIGMYGRTMLFEWLLFGFVILGVKLNGTPLLAVLGERWSSVRQVLRDSGIAIAFLVVSIFLESLVDAHLHGGGPDPAVQFLLPHGGSELAVWMALSLTAGICEETLFRGYLQKQFMALTKNAAARHPSFGRDVRHGALLIRAWQRRFRSACWARCMGVSHTGAKAFAPE